MVFCLVDPGSGQVLKTVANGSLLAATVAWQHGVLTVELAGQVVAGRPVRTGEIEASYWGRRIRVSVVGGLWAEAFSRLLGRPVLLCWAEPRHVVYGAAGSVDLDPVSGHRDLRLLDALPQDAEHQPVFGPG